MNIVKNLIANIEERFTETKNPCKTYATEAAAEKVAVQVSADLAKYFTADKHSTPRPARYVVVFVPAMGRWACGFDLSELMGRAGSCGGYLGVFPDHFKF